LTTTTTTVDPRKGHPKDGVTQQNKLPPPPGDKNHAMRAPQGAEPAEKTQGHNSSKKPLDNSTS